MYVQRLLHGTLREALGAFPAVLVTGPRQSGKTTFLRHELGNEVAYVTFDDPLEREFVHRDPEGFLDRFQTGPAILDEVQYVPELFQYLKIRIDRERATNGRWVLTGSQQFGLMAGVTESLAGRIALLDLLPFALPEIARVRRPELPETLWLGGYPEPVVFPDKRDLWVRSYLGTYVERNVRQLHSIQNLKAFETFLALAAARHGQELNVAELAREIGFSQPSTRSWIGLLEAGFLLHLLPPFFESFGKRVIRSPKLYFLDSALVATLTRHQSAEAALAGPLAGPLFEGFIVTEAVKAFAAQGKKPDLFFWRSRDGLEVDLLLAIGHRLVPIEIKLTATPTDRHVEPLERFKRLAPGRATEQGLLICRVASQRPLPGGNLALPWQDWPGWVEQVARTGEVPPRL